jgi:hypothetical protein
MEPPCFEELKHLGRIAGWLILPALGLVVNLVEGIVRTAVFVRTAGVDGGAASALVTNLLWFGCVFVVACFFFRKHRWAPRIYIGLILLNVLIAFVRAVPGGVLGHAGVFGLPRQLTLACANAAIWVPYFLTSVRVKLTFTRTWSGQSASVAA